MVEANIHAAPQLPSFTPSADSSWQYERDAFLRLLPDLISQYNGQYVAIYNGQVVDHDSSDVDLVERVIAQLGYVSLHIGLVTDAPRNPAKIPSARQF